MALDIDRAAFVLTEYRYANPKDDAIKTDYRQAAAIEIDTQLATEAGALALAERLFAHNNTPTFSYEVTIDGIDAASIDKFVGAPPRFIPNLDRYTSGKTMMPEEVTIDLNTMTTTVVLRG